MCRWFWLFLGVGAGCSLQVQGPEASSATATSTTSTGTHTSTGTGTSEPTTTAATTTLEASTSAAQTTQDSGTFLLEPEPDLPGPPKCDIFAQDCPEGQKCAWLGYWEGDMGCVPVARDPKQVGEPCTYELDPEFGWTTGVDDCARGVMCLPGNDEPGKGRCVELCKGSWDAPECDAGSVCTGGRTHWHCVPQCDPLVQDCEPGFICDFDPLTYVLGCHPDAGPPHVALGQPCSWAEPCEPSLTCADASYVPGCADLMCCTKFCPLDDPGFDCELAGQACQPGAENWPATLGLCAQL